MKPCFGYVRVSTLKQGEGVSLEAQRDAIEQFAARNNIKITKWFEEKVTAAKVGRPLFDQMVKSLKAGYATGVVFHKIDRSARNFGDWARVGDLSESGIDVHFATESLDFNSRGGRLTADIQAVIAADYIRNLREEAIKGMKGRLKQGLYPFKAPLGYLDNGKGRVKTIDPERGDLVREMFKLYASGEFSLHSLVPEMERRGLRSSQGKPLVKTSIEKILRNPFYMGQMLTRGGQIYPGKHEPLISAELFMRVRDVREGRDNKKSTKHNHLYRGLFSCGHCAGSMIPELQKGRVYYRCHKPACKTKTVREDAIDAAVRSLLRRVEVEDEHIPKLRVRFIEWIESRADSGLAVAAPREIAKLQSRLSKLTDKYIDDHIEKSLFLEKKQEITLEQAKWEEAARQKNQKETLLGKVEKFLELIKSLADTYFSANPAQKRQIVKMASSNRSVYGRTVYFEPSDWVKWVEAVLNFGNCEHSNVIPRISDVIEEVLHLVDEVEQQENN